MVNGGWLDGRRKPRVAKLDFCGVSAMPIKRIGARASVSALQRGSECERRSKILASTGPDPKRFPGVDPSVTTQKKTILGSEHPPMEGILR